MHHLKLCSLVSVGMRILRHRESIIEDSILMSLRMLVKSTSISWSLSSNTTSSVVKLEEIKRVCLEAYSVVAKSKMPLVRFPLLKIWEDSSL